MPLETPTMENLSVLTGKYGDEGDQLIFKMLNSGNYLSKTTAEDFQAGAKHLLPKIAEKGLRYDLTVPFARFVVMNRNEITFPFKRYQIQPVWRADRPQKGRYREFYQCDADVVGTDSLICEAEIIQMINKVFKGLNITDYSIKMNNRKILSGIVETIGAPGKETDFCVAIDKLDKIGFDKVLEELAGKGFSEDAIEQAKPILKLAGDNQSLLAQSKEILALSADGSKGVEELEEIFTYLDKFGAQDHHVDFDITLARGLSYYTGAIFEVKVNNVSIGSVSGGGRYDNLTGVFGLPDVPGVGFSFGVDRIYDVLEELDLFPKDNLVTTQLMIVNFDEASETHGLGLLAQLRNAGIKSEIYPNSAKLKKQMNYANKKAIPFVLMVGSEEISSGIYSLKNMETGEQLKLTIDQVIEQMK